MKKLKPHKGHVILRPLDSSEQKYGRIILPDTGNEKPILAEVIEVSEGVYNYRTDKLIPLEVKKGDIVVVPKMGALSVSVEGTDYYIAQADQLSATLIEELDNTREMLEKTKKFLETDESFASLKESSPSYWRGKYEELASNIAGRDGVVNGKQTIV